MTNDQLFLEKCRLREQIGYLRKSGEIGAIPELQLKLDRLHECGSGESTAESLMKGLTKVINWPKYDHRFGFCLDMQLKDILEVRINDWGFEKQTFEPADEMQLIDVVSSKIEELGLYDCVHSDGTSLGDLVYAYSWDGSKYIYWRWDEKNYDFLVPLKRDPLIWRRCDEDEAYRILSVQRSYNRYDSTGYVFGYFLTGKIGDRILRDMVCAARFGLQKTFVEYIFGPALRRIGWKRDFMDIVMLRTHGGMDFGCEGWDIEKRTFSVSNSGWDFDTQRWLGFTRNLEMYPKEEGFHPVWVPECLAYLIMNALSDFNLDPVRETEVHVVELSALVKAIEYQGFQIETFCGIQFGSQLMQGEDSSSKTLKLNRAFRGFETASCDYTRFHKRLYRITLVQMWHDNVEAAQRELYHVKDILSEKYRVVFEKLPLTFRKDGVVLESGLRLLKRTADSSGTLRMVADCDFALVAERGCYQFALYIRKIPRETHYFICISIEDSGLYNRDEIDFSSAWRVRNAKLRDNDGIEVL